MSYMWQVLRELPGMCVGVGGGVYQVSTASNLEALLDLRSLSKSLRVHQGQLPSTWTIAVGVGPQGVTMVELEESPYYSRFRFGGV